MAASEDNDTHELQVEEDGNCSNNLSVFLAPSGSNIIKFNKRCCETAIENDSCKDPKGFEYNFCSTVCNSPNEEIYKTKVRSLALGRSSERQDYKKRKNKQEIMALIQEHECCRKFITELPKHVSRKDAEHNFTIFLGRTKYDALYVHFKQSKVTLVCFDAKCHKLLINGQESKSCRCLSSEELIFIKKEENITKCKPMVNISFCLNLKEIKIKYKDIIHCHTKLDNEKITINKKAQKYVKSRDQQKMDKCLKEDLVYSVNVTGEKSQTCIFEKCENSHYCTFSVKSKDCNIRNTDSMKAETKNSEYVDQLNIRCSQTIVAKTSTVVSNEVKYETESDKIEEPCRTVYFNELKNDDHKVEQVNERQENEESDKKVIAVTSCSTDDDGPQLEKCGSQYKDSNKLLNKTLCTASIHTFEQQEKEKEASTENAGKADEENGKQRDGNENTSTKNDSHYRSNSGDKERSKKTKRSVGNRRECSKDEKYEMKVIQTNQELLKMHKKPFRQKKMFIFPLESTPCKEGKQTDLFSTKVISFFKKILETSKKYIKEHFLREILNFQRSWYVEILAFPAKKSKSGKSSRRRSQDRQNQFSQQDRQNQSPQGAEGGPDRYPVQVSESETDGLSLPTGDRVVTSTNSVFRPPTSATPTTNQLSVDAERSLLSRIRSQLPASRFSTPPQPPRHPQYRDQPSRQQSYTNWPSSTGQDPARMAVYGLFYTGRFDLVRCFQCGIGLKDWSGTDEPLFEHIRHSGECPFLKDLLGQDLLNAYKENLRSSQVPPTNPAGSSSGQVSGRVRNPQYADLQARIRSFLSWPASNLQRPEVLAEAGLFFTGTNDLCRCFTCDGGLQRWDSDDDPWIEHARWFPQCAYVRQMKGQDYIDMVQQAAAAAREEEDPIVFPPGQSREGPIEQRMEELSLQRRDPLSTPEALRVIGMGYSRKAVLLAIHEFSGRSLGARNDFTTEDLVAILREREQRGEALPPDSPQDSTGVNLEVLAENMDPEELNRHLRGILKCMRCEVNDSNILFLPCTHHRMCEDCAVEVTVCPICGRKVDDKIRTFMS